MINKRFSYFKFFARKKTLLASGVPQECVCVRERRGDDASPTLQKGAKFTQNFVRKFSQYRSLCFTHQAVFVVFPVLLINVTTV